MCRTFLGSLAVFTAEKKGALPRVKGAPHRSKLYFGLPTPTHSIIMWSHFLSWMFFPLCMGLGQINFQLPDFHLSPSPFLICFPFSHLASSSAPLFFHHYMHSLFYFSPLGELWIKLRDPISGRQEFCKRSTFQNNRIEMRRTTRVEGNCGVLDVCS